MNDYCNGIAYATGYFANDSGQSPYLVVRNLEKYYIELIANEVGYSPYESFYNIQRDGKSQWVVKAKNVHSLPPLTQIQNTKDFCRGYIELHGVIDMATAKNRKGEYFKKPRLRIYGKEEIVVFINKSLPVSEKKIQHIANVVDTNYIGKTCVIYYQSKSEILDILNWIDGTPKNLKVWEKWGNIKGLFQGKGTNDDKNEN